MHLVKLNQLVIATALDAVADAIAIALIAFPQVGRQPRRKGGSPPIWIGAR